ncbi:MAG TPA: EamA family transporter [Aestuariivirga sp.]|nr:EamA family transporter [Aestuariivirga sp.]
MTSSRGTLFGVLAIAAWSSYGVLLASNGRTNPVMAAAILFTSATVLLLALRIVRGQGLASLFAIPISTLALGVTGLFGSNLFYVVALALGGAPVPVNIAALSWPVFMALFVVLFGVARATWYDAVAMLFGFGGVVLLAIKGGDLTIDWPVLPAFIGALCWAIYSALRTRVPAGPPDAMLAFVGVSAILCWVISFMIETPELPPSEDLLRLVLVGFLPVGLANYFWDFATRYGDPVLMAGLSFLEPLSSTALIAVVLWQPVGVSDAGALLLILLAVLLSIMSERLRRNSASLQSDVSPS